MHGQSSAWSIMISIWIALRNKQKKEAGHEEEIFVF